MRELPPLLSGDALRQIAALRDYLVRCAAESGTEDGGAVPQTAERTGSGPAAGRGTLSSAPEKGKEKNDQAARLRALIVKTAEDSRDRDAVLTSSVGELSLEMRQSYLAKSEFGSYRRELQLLIEATARQIVESYEYLAQIRATRAELGEMGEELAAYREEISGQIRRGYLEDPETRQTVLGIAIAQQLQFTGQEISRDGRSYYQLSPGQTLGLYTSTGWQFWVNGRKVGWFDSSDGMLHTVSQAVEESLRIGSWTVSAAGGFGIKYTG